MRTLHDADCNHFFELNRKVLGDIKLELLGWFSLLADELVDLLDLLRREALDLLQLILLYHLIVLLQREQRVLLAHALLVVLLTTLRGVLSPRSPLPLTVTTTFMISLISRISMMLLVPVLKFPILVHPVLIIIIPSLFLPEIPLLLGERRGGKRPEHSWKLLRDLRRLLEMLFLVHKSLLVRVGVGGLVVVLLGVYIWGGVGVHASLKVVLLLVMVPSSLIVRTSGSSIFFGNIHCS